MRTFSQNLHVLFFGFQVGINVGNPNAGMLERKSAPVEHHVEHSATGSVPGAGPSAQDIAKRMTDRTGKALRSRVKVGHVTNKAGLFECAAACLTLEEELQQPLACVKVKMIARGLDILPEDAIDDATWQSMCQMANDGHVMQVSQIVTREDRQRIQLTSLEARCANLSRADKQVLKGLRALRRKGLI